jgi:hypothetical protein
VPPVKEIRGMSGCFTMASPTLGPKPNTKFTTPGGNPEKKFRCSQTCLN